MWTSSIFHTSLLLLFLTQTYIYQNLTRVVLPLCGEFSFLFRFYGSPPAPNLINADEAVTTPQSTCLQMEGPRCVRPYLVSSILYCIPASIHHNNLSSSLLLNYMFIISLLLVSHHFSFWLVIIWLVITFPPSDWLTSGCSSLFLLLVGYHLVVHHFSFFWLFIIWLVITFPFLIGHDFHPSDPSDWSSSPSFCMSIISLLLIGYHSPFSEFVIVSLLLIGFLFLSWLVILYLLIFSTYSTQCRYKELPVNSTAEIQHVLLAKSLWSGMVHSGADLGINCLKWTAFYRQKDVKSGTGSRSWAGTGSGKLFGIWPTQKVSDTS